MGFTSEFEKLKKPRYFADHTSGLVLLSRSGLAIIKYLYTFI